MTQPTASSAAVLTLGRLLFTLIGLLPTTLADGNGLIGWGKHMYQPACAFACRNIVRACPLLCTPKPGGKNYGTAHSPNWTPPECFTTDAAFMQTMALCIDNYCPGSDEPPLSMLEDYWASHLGVTTVGNYQWVPSMSFVEARRIAREEEKAKEHSAGGNSTASNNNGSSGEHTSHSRLRIRQHEETASSGSGAATQMFKSALPTIKARAPLNVTSFILYDDWKRVYNGATLFETNEVGHSNATIAVLFTALFVPVILSMLRFIPGLSRSRTWTWINCMINHPAAFGNRHREPIALTIGGAIVPTRGQLMYIALISFLNFILLVMPYYYVTPNSTYPIRRHQDIATIGNRAGSMAMGNAAAVFIFSARNNLLLWLTDWSHGTFLLLHRWLGIWTVLLTIMHSCLLLAAYVEYGDYPMELAREYWAWGIVGTVAAVSLLPASLMSVRRAAYELFLPLHHILSILFLVGYFYHIWYLYGYQWGYEIWVWVTVGVWALDRVVRLARAGAKGLRTATISAVDGSQGDYLRIDIDGVRAKGVVYLFFPTLRWIFWENHPFSVISSAANITVVQKTPLETAKNSVNDAESSKEKSAPGTVVSNLPPSSKLPHEAAAAAAAIATTSGPSQTRTTIIARTRTGVTARLAACLAASTGSFRLPVLVEGSYSYSSSAESQLRGCSSVLCIAGGVGVTAVLPLLRDSASPSRRGRLIWGLRDASLPTALAPELTALRVAGVEVETSIGKRVDVATVLRQEMLSGSGLLGVVVSGPPGMADDVRRHLSQLGKEGRRAVIFVDEAFTW